MITESSRLILSEFHPSEGSFYYALNNDPEVLKYTGDDSFESVEAATNFLKHYNHYKHFGYGRWTVTLKETNKPIGWCGLKYHKEQDYVDLGYRFLRSEWGEGYATEAALASLKIGFTEYKMPFIVGRTARQNHGSIRVLEKVGMTFWKAEACEGIEDSLIYRVDREEFIGKF